MVKYPHHDTKPRDTQMKCEALITREFKTVKANSISPEMVTVRPDLYPGAHEVCGGDVGASVKAVDRLYYGGHSSELRISATCSRCKYPYTELLCRLNQSAEINNEIDLTPFL